MNSGQKPVKVQHKEHMEERRNVYSKTEIENLIKGQIAQEMEKTETKKPKDVRDISHIRKYASPIAVYIRKEDETKENGTKFLKLEETSRQDHVFGISTGTKIKAVLANAIFSFNVSSPVIAFTDEDVIKDGKVIIPKGTQFIGNAGILKSRDRVNVLFSVMIPPCGKELKIRAMALSLDGSGGIAGKVEKQYDKSFLKAAGEILLGGAALVVGTTSTQAMTLEDEVRLNAARNLTDDAQGALSQVRIEESIRVEAYTPILVLVLESF